MKVLTRSDEILLLAILRLKDDAYSTSILKELKKRTGKELTIGSLWVSLDSLHKKRLIYKMMGDETPLRGGRKKIYYSLTQSGIEALHEAKELQRSLWTGISWLLKKYNKGQ